MKTYWTINPLERLEELKSQVPAAITRKNLGAALDLAVRAATGVEPSISRLEALRAFMPLVRDHLDSLDTQESRRQLVNLRGLAQQLENASDIETLSEVTQSVAHQLTPGVEQTDQVVRRGWKEKIEQAFSSTGRLGSVLRQIPETQQLRAEMESLFHRAQQLSASIEDATRSSEQFTALKKDRDHTNDKLVALGAGEGVVDFLLAVAGQTATLEKVTGDVREWLDARGALERFKVGL
jgi:hypothetical protein